MTYSIYWSKQAIESLDSIKAYISQVSSSKAQKVVSDLVIYARQLEKFPFLGTTDERFGDNRLRKLIQGEYFLVYRVTDSQIEIIDVFSGRQDFQARLIQKHC
ncbi:plasmid stabilization system protein ParE [Anaerobacterium chartisolvens]|uniref:Plasmid stabilization system protein ParE n=1 Tax=Anaerobacterium chartisolvens TaxID=1297424 RepID=A0A369BBS8_9FIRM|nr:type II toxin-antitoxin system RelE/ParE family toxin [Anaerobacterium chartisolvens]RCX18026.1 plasmid stabilization system protein ParE [Anaerobacterium chartisolvens]